MVTTSTGDDELGRIFQVEEIQYKRKETCFLGKGGEAGKQSSRSAQVWDLCWGGRRGPDARPEHLPAVCQALCWRWRTSEA